MISGSGADGDQVFLGQGWTDNHNGTYSGGSGANAVTLTVTGANVVPAPSGFGVEGSLPAIGELFSSGSPSLAALLPQGSSSASQSAVQHGDAYAAYAPPPPSPLADELHAHGAHL